MKREDIIRFYTPCSEAQRTKIEGLMNERRLKAYEDKRDTGYRVYQIRSCRCSDI